MLWRYTPKTAHATGLSIEFIYLQEGTERPWGVAAGGGSIRTPRDRRPPAKAYATSGYKAALRIWAHDLAQVQGNPASPSMVADVYAYLGETDQALSGLERGYMERDGFLVDLKNAVWQPLHSDRRFDDLVRRVGLPR